MNIVIGMLIVAFALLMVKPVQAVNDRIISDFIPSLAQSSFKIPILGEVLASGEITINAIDGSGQKGIVRLKEVPQNLDTQITVHVFGLNPDEQYIAFYHQNPNCQMEEGNFEKSIKGAFYPNENGNSQFDDVVKDSINRIKSVSIRTSKDFNPVACGQI